MNAQVSHAFHTGSLTVEPTVGGYGVTRKGFYPIASVGARLIEGTASKLITQAFDCMRAKLEA